ncbi:MAG: 2-oxoacid:ferredoxin oxidoreductase subunit alpha [Candidatus Bathyarchaeia archaeon]|jgi:2-oxoglutarate ferredoxin oxidoreductase subunit alpha
MEEINWMAGGPQGAGVDSAANIFGRACGYGGLYVFGRREYHSNIKGLHSYFHLRASQREVLANVNDVDLLAAFDAETVVRHVGEVVSGGGIIVDKEQVGTRVLGIPTLPPEFRDEVSKYIGQKGLGESLSDFLDDAKKTGVHVFEIPYMELLKTIAARLGIEQLSKVTRMINVLTMGVSFALLDYERGLVEKAVTAVFSDKPKVVEMNIMALREAYDYTKRTFIDAFPYRLVNADAKEERIFVSGNEAVAMGKVLGGCRVQTYYPITPAADESEYLEAHEILKTKAGEGGIVVLQTEDEIAAVNSASGAALAGARAATSTSGPGFSLMVEGLSWAGNSEVPLVITYYQRGAPATGLPTRHGQADLRFAVHAGHGEFPRIILASGDIRECFYDAARAFNYAERFQLPVIHLIDKAMANCSQTYPLFDTSHFKIQRGDILDETKLQDQPYKRFSFTDTGVSPRVVLGTRNGVHWCTGDEHNEFGHISEEPFNRVKMVEKRMKKLELINKEVPVEEKVNFFGDRGSENMVVSWGSPKGAILEAMEALKAEGFSLGFMQLRMLHPLPKEYVASTLKKARKVIDVEGNYLGQLGGMLKEETGVQVNFYVLKYTGRPITTTEVYAALKNVLSGQAAERQVLTYGS